MQKIELTIVLLPVLGLFGCTRLPRLIDQEGAAFERISQQAPIVVVGEFLSDKFIRRQQSHRDPAYPLQLRVLQVRIENVLKGDLTTGPVAVYYFSFAGGFNGPAPLGFWSMGQRRVLYLRKDSGVLRTACDGFDDCTLWLGSGAHPQLKRDPMTPLAHAIGDLFLTKGDGVSDDAFAASIERGAPGIIPEAYLIEKLQRLAATGSAPVRKAACSTLKMYGHPCLER